MTLYVLVGGLCVVSALLAYRLWAILTNHRPYWGGSATESYIDKADNPRMHGFYVIFTTFALAVSVGMTSLFIWAFFTS